MTKFLGPNFGIDVRALPLTGLSTATNAAITATDSVLGASGKLQAQITAEISRAQAAEDWLVSGAVMDGTTDDTAALQASLAAVPTNGVWQLPAGTFRIKGTGTQIFLRTSPITIVGASNGGTIFSIDSTTGTTTDIFRFQPVTGLRGPWRVQGLNFTSSDLASHGRYLFNWDATALATQTFGEIDFCNNQLYLPNGNPVCLTAALFHNAHASNANGGIFHSTFRNNMIFGAVTMTSLGDTIDFDRNQFAGSAGIVLQQVVGAGQLTFMRNNVTNTAGMVIDGATRPVIAFNEFEQQAVTTNPNSAVLSLRGATVAIVGAVITCNQIQALAATGPSATNAPSLIYIGSASDVHIGGLNYFAQNGSATRVNDIVVSASASRTQINNRNQVIWGGGSVSNLLQVSDLGSSTTFEGAPLSNPNFISTVGINGLTSIQQTWFRNDGTTGNKAHGLTWDGFTFNLGHYSDTFTGYTPWLTMVRAATVTSSLTLTAPTITLTGNASVTGTLTLPTANTGLEIGSTASANTPYIDWHSSGNANDADVRAMASSGAVGAFGGTMTWSLGAMIINAPTSITSTLTVTDIVLNSTTNLAGAWTSTTRTVSASTGTMTATGTVRSLKMGRTVFFNLAVTAITNTSGTGMVNVSMPWTNAAPLTVFTGRENGATGRPLEAYLSGATLSIVYATDLAFPGATGNSLYVSGVIEATA